MNLDGGEFIRRFLIHMLPGWFHRLRSWAPLATAIARSSGTRSCSERRQQLERALIAERTKAGAERRTGSGQG